MQNSESLRVYIWVQVGDFVRRRSYFFCSLVFLLVLGWDSTTAVTVNSGGSFGVLGFIRRAFYL